MHARRQLLTSAGGAVEWHAELAGAGGFSAPALSLENMLRLIHSPMIEWRRVPRAALAAASARELAVREIDVATDVWGREAFAVRVRCTLAPPPPAASAVARVLEIVRDRRREWDPICAGLDVVERPHADDDAVDDGAADDAAGAAAGAAPGGAPVGWDIVRFHSCPPTVAKALRCACACTPPRSTVELSLLRAWRLEDGAAGSALLTSRSVRHPATRPELEVAPSGFLMTPAEGGGVDLRYVVEFELESARKNIPGLPDSRFPHLMARAIGKSMQCLQKLVASGAPAQE